VEAMAAIGRCLLREVLLYLAGSVFECLLSGSM